MGKKVRGVVFPMMKTFLLQKLTQTERQTQTDIYKNRHTKKTATATQDTHNEPQSKTDKHSDGPR